MALTYRPLALVLASISPHILARFSFSVSPGTFSGLDTVESVSVDFAFSASGSTTSTINYLIVGHRFNT